MPETSASGEAHVKWVVFGDNCAVLRRMIRTDGARGLLLQFTARGRYEDVRRRARRGGFREFGETGDLYMMAPAGRLPAAVSTS